MEKNYDCLRLSNQLCFPLYAAARRVTQLYTPHLSPLGLTYTQYLVFMVLSEKEPQTVGEMGEKLFLDNGTLSPMLKTLEKKGFVQRKRKASDERVVEVSLTEAGKNLLDDLAKIPAKVGQCVPLTAEEGGDLYQLLYRILNETQEK